MKKKIYLACPYSHPDPLVMQQRFVKVTQMAGKLMEQGFIVFSPISHSHPIASLGNLPRDWAFWWEQDRAWLDACDELYILTLDGWRESVGIKDEIARAMALDMPIQYISETP
jgi:nucleoside 2-deoxyribosyltransferase